MIKIDVQGRKRCAGAIGENAGLYIYLLPPSLEALEERLVDRATEDPDEPSSPAALRAVAELAAQGHVRSSGCGLTIIFARCGFDHRAGFRRRLATETNDEPLDTLIAAGEAAAIHQVLPDAFGVAALGEFQLDGFPVWLAGTAAGGCFGCGRRRGRQYRARVGVSLRLDWPVLPPGGRGSLRWPVLPAHSVPKHRHLRTDLVVYQGPLRAQHLGPNLGALRRCAADLLGRLRRLRHGHRRARLEVAWGRASSHGTAGSERPLLERPRHGGHFRLPGVAGEPALDRDRRGIVLRQHRRLHRPRLRERLQPHGASWTPGNLRLGASRFLYRADGREAAGLREAGAGLRDRAGRPAATHGRGRAGRGRPVQRSHAHAALRWLERNRRR